VRNLIKQFRDTRRYFRASNKIRRIVFYSEGPSYWPYFEDISDHLIDRLGRDVCYLTSSAVDPALAIHKSGFHPFYIGSSFIRSITMINLRAGVAVMTAPDLGKLYFRKSVHPVHYIYLPHNINSTHMVFRERAFNGYDSILCVGPHQLAEHQEAEKIYGLSPRNLIKIGYPKLDALRKSNREITPSSIEPEYRVMIAPSWGENSLFSFGCDVLLENLLDAGFRVILRPHRDTGVDDPAALARIRSRFGGRENLVWAKDLVSDDPYFGAHALITDWSGSSFSFAFGAERPVLFIDMPKKINNKDFSKFNAIPLEVSLRAEMGEILSTERMGDAAKILKRLCSDPDYWSRKLSQLRRTWCYNEGHSAEQAAATISELAGRNGPVSTAQ
jgi:hypothetical protein